MANVALRCTDPGCVAHGKVQTTKTCAVCGKPTTWSVLRVPPTGQAPIGPIYTMPMPLKNQSEPTAGGRRDPDLPNSACARFRWAQDDPFCGACGNPTVAATTI